MRNTGRIGGVAVAAALLLSTGALASAAPDAQTNTYLRLAHLSPDTPHVDVYVAGVRNPSNTLVVKGVGYGVVSTYQAVPADSYTISMRAAGAPADSPPVLSTTVDGVAGKAFTIAGMGKYAELALKVLTDDLSLPQSPGKARVRVIQATTTAPSLDVGVAGGDSIAKGVAFAQTTGYQEVAAGRWTLVAAPPGAAGHELPVTLSEGAVYTVLLVDKNGRLATQLYTDAKGPDAIPSGGIETGARRYCAEQPVGRRARRRGRAGCGCGVGRPGRGRSSSVGGLTAMPGMPQDR